MLVTLATLKSYLWITWTESDAILQILLDSAESTIKTRTWREFELDTSDRTEILNGNAQLELIVQKYPIVTLVSVSKNTGTISSPVWEVIDPDYYSAEKNIGVINLLSPSCRGFENYRVIYRGGYATIPWDLQLACMKMAGSSFNRIWTDGIKSETVNWDRIEFENSELPHEVETTISNYRRPYV